MIDGLKPYPAYKDSGVPWLGQVPEHWEVSRIKRSAKLNPAKSELSSAFSDDEPVTFLPMELMGADGRVDVRESRPISAVRNGFTYFRRSDVIVAKITPCFENGKGACLDFLPTEVGFGSTEFHVLRALESILPQFLYRVTTLPDFRHLGAEAMKGAAGQQRVPQSFIGDFQVALPPLPEQSPIVRFLDHADRRIRRYIRAKRKLIELLNEQKQAIIQRAVTRGLDPNVRLKPSGVEWLGDVPAHWEHYRLKALLRPVDIRSATGQETLLSLRRDHGVVVYAEHFARPYQAQSLIGFKIVEVGQLVVNRLQANNGLIFSSGVRGLVSPDYSVFAARRDLDMTYLQELLRTSIYRAQFRRESTGLGTGAAGFLRLYDDRFLETRVLLPPYREQRQLLTSTAERISELNRMMANERKELVLVGEYRTRLIADVVTGKLDVREAAARLPEEPGEPEPLDDTSALAETDAQEEADLAEATEDAEV